MKGDESEVITKTQWESLSEKEKWDVQVALRGPDCHNSEHIKYYTTAVIRAAVMKVMRVGGTVNTDLKIVVVPDWSGGSRKLTPPWRELPYAWNFSHFFEHIIGASEVLGIPRLHIEAGAWFEAIEKASNYIDTGVRMYKALSQEQASRPEGLEFYRHLERYIVK